MHSVLIEMQKKLNITLPVNNSSLGDVKRYLANIPPFLGGEKYLIFGGEFHSNVLEGKSRYDNIDDESKLQIKYMTASLIKHPVYIKAMKGKPIIEKLIFGEVLGVSMRGTLDIHNRNTVYDLKTTSETSEKAFIRKALKIGYLRQSIVYKALTGAEHFIFIGVCKKPPYPIFILDTQHYEKETKQQEKELKFLLEVVKTICNKESK
jgi:hypothetical protein